MTSPPLLIAMRLTLLASAFYCFIGVNALRRLQKLLRSFDLIAETAGARGEIRAIYGGMTLALALMLSTSLILEVHGVGILLAAAGLTLEMAAGRLLSAIIEKSLGEAHRFWCSAELAVASALFAAAALRQ